MIRSLALVALVLAVPALAGPGQQIKRVKTGNVVGYLEYLPQDYDDRPAANFPVVIFFHGIGENGLGTEADLDRVLNNSGGPPVFIRDGAHFPFIVISGQHFAQPNTNCWSSAEIDTLIEHVKTTYRVDTNRIYLTGLSCGAIGLWSYLDNVTLSQKAAAAMPISGSGGSFSNTARLDVPTWIFHGAADGTVQACTDDANATTINGLVPPVVPSVRATFVAAQGHTGWNQVYGNTRAGCNVYEWMSRFDKSVPRVARSVAVDGGTVGDPSVQLTGPGCSRMSAVPTTSLPNTSAGSCVIVTAAPPPTGKIFDHWDTGGVQLDIPATESANFVMPDQSVTLSPVYRDAGTAYVDTISPKVWLTTPSAAAAYSTSLASLTLAGTAIDDVGVTQVSWVNSAGGMGNATLPGGTTTMRAFRAVVALSAGVNTVTFTARDAAMHTTTTVVTITRGAIVNMPPTVNAGTDATIALPAMASLQGTANDDGLPGAMTITWSKFSGPGNVTFTNAANAVTTASFSAAGTYVLRLTATDSALTATDDVRIIVTPAMYALTVTGGTGSGSYAAGAMVNLVSNAPPTGQVFERWNATAGTVAMPMSPSSSFTMPASNATVTAMFTTGTAFTLTVVNGTGGGSFAAGTQVAIQADAAATGQLFAGWVTTAGTLANAANASTMITMPAADATVTATFQTAPTFSLTVTGGTGSGTFAVGSSTPITANAPPSGQVFDRWLGEATALNDVLSASTSVTMPARAVTVRSSYRDVAAVPTVTGFSLIDATTSLPINAFNPLGEGAPLNLPTLPSPLSVRANVAGPVASVQFLFDGLPVPTDENTAPYVMPLTLTLGTHTITATAFSGPDATGTSGTTVTVSFTVTDEPSDPAPQAPTGLIATATGATTIELDWPDSTESDVYVWLVFRDGVQIGEVGESSFDDVALTASTTYSYRIIAVDERSQQSVPSDEAIATTRAEASGVVMGGCGCTQAPIAAIAWLALGALATFRRRRQ